MPAYGVASWSDQGLHTRGTLEGYKRIRSKHKWLTVHGRKKWQYYHQPESVERLRLFFDRFLKGVENEVESWPRVRLEVRDRFYEGEIRDEAEWPLARTRHEKLYLDAASKTLGSAAFGQESEIRYETDGRAEFVYRFPQTTELTGPKVLKLRVGATDADDRDMFVVWTNIDAEGKRG